MIDDCGSEGGNEQCIILYAECDFTGFSTRICDDTPFTDIDYEIKSLTVPEGMNVYLYNMPCFNGLDAEFTHDVACLEAIDFSLLEIHGIKLLEENAFMTASEGTLHAKYRRPNLRKAGTLKSYERI
jgi:hypothetical protein